MLGEANDAADPNDPRDPGPAAEDTDGSAFISENLKDKTPDTATDSTSPDKESPEVVKDSADLEKDPPDQLKYDDNYEALEHISTPAVTQLTHFNRFWSKYYSWQPTHSYNLYFLN